MHLQAQWSCVGADTAAVVPLLGVMLDCTCLPLPSFLHPQVEVFEEKSVVGGACRTEYPFPKVPGLGHSTGAYLLGVMPPELMQVITGVLGGGEWHGGGGGAGWGGGDPIYNVPGLAHLTGTYRRGVKPPDVMHGIPPPPPPPPGPAPPPPPPPQNPFSKVPGLGHLTGAYLLGVMPPEVMQVITRRQRHRAGASIPKSSLWLCKRALTVQRDEGVLWQERCCSMRGAARGRGGGAQRAAEQGQVGGCPLVCARKGGGGFQCGGGGGAGDNLLGPGARQGVCTTQQGY